MKKRLMALLMTLILCISLIPVFPVYAAEAATVNASADSTATEQSVSDWAIGDLLVGSTYGIFPVDWSSLDMTVPVSEGKLWVLLAGIRCKLLETDCVTDNPDIIYDTKKNMTVEEVLTTYYSVLSNMKFTSELGFKGASAVENMKEAGVYKGTDGEPGLTEVCTLEDACVYATRIITYTYNELGAASKGFLWQAKSGGNTVYMLGSIHLASTEIYPLSQNILQAYQSADALVVEVDLFDIMGAYTMVMLGVYSDGTTLKDHVSAETYQKVITLATKYGYDEETISLFKPWFIYTLFTSVSYTDSGSEADAELASLLGIDMNFLTDAYLNGKPVLQIEGYEYQSQVLNSFSDELAEYLLNSTIDSLNAVQESGVNINNEYLKYVLALWHDGDVESFLAINSMDEDYLDTSDISPEEKALIEEYESKLITQRDLGMADYIEGLLTAEGSSTYFVVVGSAHYISDYSVLDILKERGYEITQIK